MKKLVYRIIALSLAALLLGLPSAFAAAYGEFVFGANSWLAYSEIYVADVLQRNSFVKKYNTGGGMDGNSSYMEFTVLPGREEYTVFIQNDGNLASSIMTSSSSIEYVAEFDYKVESDGKGNSSEFLFLFRLGGANLQFVGDTTSGTGWKHGKLTAPIGSTINGGGFAILVTSLDGTGTWKAAVANMRVYSQNAPGANLLQNSNVDLTWAAQNNPILNVTNTVGAENGDELTLTWTPNGNYSLGSSALHHSVRIYNNRTEDLLGEVNAQVRTFMPSDYVPGVYYEYKLASVDMYGNEAEGVVVKSALPKPNEIDDIVITSTGTGLSSDIKITGELPYANSAVELTFYKGMPGAGTLVYTNDSLQTDELGKYSCAFQEDLASGNYYAQIQWGGEKINTKTVLYTNSNEQTIAFEDVNSSTIAAELKLAVEEHWESLELDMRFYNDYLTADQRLLALENLLSKKGAAFGSVGALASSFWDCTLLAAVNAASADSITEILSDSKVFLTSNKLYGMFNGLSGEGQQIVCNVLAAKTDFISLKPGVEELFEQSVILSAVETASGHDLIYGILSASNDILKLNFSAYLSLSNKSNADKAIVNTKFSDTEALAAAFNQAVSAEAEKERQQSASKGSSGGSSSKGGGAPQVLYIDQSVNANEQNEPVVSQNSSELSGKTFDDLGSAPWAEESIEALADRGIINGVGGREFAPEKNVTREEFIKMLVNALQLDIDGMSSEFNDVDVNEWYYPYVSCGVSLGIIKGYDDNTFGIGDCITREDMAVMTERILTSAGYSSAAGEKAEFDDGGEISEYAKDSVGLLRQAGLIKGDGNNMFNPRTFATRAESAHLIWNIIGLMEEETL